MKYIFIFFLINFSLSAQLKGVVVDENNAAIPFVNIWVESENIGTTSDENGKFELNIKEEKNIIFSALGFEKEMITSSKTVKVVLIQKVYELNDVVVELPKNSEEIIIGDYKDIKLNSGVTNSGQENVHIWGKFINLNQKTEKHPFVKSIQFKTRSSLKNAIMRLRIFSVSIDGDAESDRIESDILVNIKKGTKDNVVDLSKYRIKIPKEGIIFGFEYLKLEQNKKEYSYTEQGSTIKHKAFKYEPSVLGFLSDYNNLMLLDKEGKFKERRYYFMPEIGLKITLSN